MLRLRRILSLWLIAGQVAFAGLPPTTSKVTSDSTNVTTFNYLFPNFTGTHTGTSLSIGVNSVVGGGTGLATLTANAVLLGNGTSNPTFVAPSTSGNVLTSNGTTWQSTAPSAAAYTKATVQRFLSTGTTAGYFFTVTSANATAGATYTNNGNTYTVLNTLAAGTRLYCSQASAPQASGTLTKASGTGDSTITFSSSTALGSYVSPSSPAPLYLTLRLYGGGGGGAGGGVAGGTGGTGVDSTFGGVVIAGGGTGGTSGGAGAAGGTASASSGTIVNLVNGGGGGAGNPGPSITASVGGTGGNGCDGGGGFAGLPSATTAGNGGAGATNSGSGGGGAGEKTSDPSGAGGGAASCAEVILNPGTYYYNIGTGGAGGAGGSGSVGVGGVGAAGKAIVVESYQ